MKINKGRVRKLIRELPSRLGMTSLALIMCIGEGVINTLAGILEGPKLTIGKAYQRAAHSKSFWDYYGDLKDLQENSLYTALWRLQQKGLVEKKKTRWQLTSLGLKYFQLIKNNSSVRENWDKKWRIVMFDIPEKIKEERTWLRNELYFLGYKLLQKSVFIGKLPLKEKLFKEILGRNLKSYINIITVGEIDDEKILEDFE